MQNNKTQENLIILGVDPGYEKLGIAIIEKDGAKKEKVLFSGCIRTDKDLSHSKRLLSIAQDFSEIIETFKPNHLGIETLFFNANQKTAMPVAEARGVILYKATEKNLTIHEFSPPQIKLAVTGDGRADKKQIKSMVEKLLKVERRKREDDEFDALAIALTTSAYLH